VSRAFFIAVALTFAFSMTIGWLLHKAVHPEMVPLRIDWATVPEAPPYIREHKPTEAQLAFKRERKRMYAALEFERTPWVKP